MNTTRPQRRPRADARRNYERLLAEADSAFREKGTDASLENIARQAGVAIGTLYGHFPNRRALVGALLRDRNDALFEIGDRLLTHPSAAEALAAWVHAVVEHAAVYRGLVAMLMEGLDDEASELHASCVRMNVIGERLIANAHAAGVIRHDATAADVSALMNAAAWAREQMPEEQADRFLRFAMDGLRLTP
ncbi:AcrR family transcriptional regulator [Streptosporangium album]|uniref:AcrR family transcriptional regulator n=1 Tax=Streptosporangium album TaxID=47479 RepID=A0A7W7S2D7_9ACTN|nr:TetR/AcrR family transcriptional regulator [Streptosporangium album]MBB4942625.1 AcrR family transcriptional regulator [Streptosporangium album]